MLVHDFLLVLGGRVWNWKNMYKLETKWKQGFDWKRPCFGGDKAKNRGQTGSRYIHIYIELQCTPSEKGPIWGTWNALCYGEHYGETEGVFCLFAAAKSLTQKERPEILDLSSWWFFTDYTMGFITICNHHLTKYVWNFFQASEANPGIIVIVLPSWSSFIERWL